ncbi:DUF5707 domain-containing protein [Streptomyces sp. NPDC029526]|uniref:DUF5707 domain-containing protein n=1 Tax=Streptomyces sp. NPDC029526 TaxID=3155728 RepID=UPI0033D6E001
MSTRLFLSTLAAGIAVAGVTAGGAALASSTRPSSAASSAPSSAPAAGGPVLENGTARYRAPSATGAGSFTYSVDVRDDAAVRSLRVLPWPASSSLNPSRAELRSAEPATCRSAGEGVTRCTYTLKVTHREAAAVDHGTWYVSVLVTAEDGGTRFVRRAATVDVRN